VNLSISPEALTAIQTLNYSADVDYSKIITIDAVKRSGKPCKVLTIDVGATHVNILGRGQKERREFEPGPKLTPKLKHDSSTNSLIRRYRKMRDTL
jgi:hypothetical protein